MARCDISHIWRIPKGLWRTGEGLRQARFAGSHAFIAAPLLPAGDLGESGDGLALVVVQVGAYGAGRADPAVTPVIALDTPPYFPTYWCGCSVCIPRAIISRTKRLRGISSRAAASRTFASSSSGRRAGPGCLDSASRKLSGLLPGLCERGALRFSRRGGRA